MRSGRLGGRLAIQRQLPREARALQAHGSAATRLRVIGYQLLEFCLLEERLSTVEEKSLDIGVGWLLEPSVE